VLALVLILGLFVTVLSGLTWRGWSGEEWETSQDLVSEDYFGLPFAWLTWRAILHTDSGQGVWIRSELVNLPMLILDWLIWALVLLLAILSSHLFLAKI
jgi:hypothetical protein